MLIAQVPTGALADALGRRRLLVAAGFFTAIAELGYVYAPGVRAHLRRGGRPRDRVRAADSATRRTSSTRWLTTTPRPSSPHAGRSVGRLPVCRRDLVPGGRADRDILAAARVLAHGGLRALASAIATRLPDGARASPPRRPRAPAACVRSSTRAARDADARVEHLLGRGHELVVGRAPASRAGARRTPSWASSWAGDAGRFRLLVGRGPHRRGAPLTASVGPGDRGGGLRAPGGPRPPGLVLPVVLLVSVAVRRSSST